MKVLVLSCQFSIFDTCELAATSPCDDISRPMLPVWEDKAVKRVSIRIRIISFLAELFLHNKTHLPLKAEFLLRGSGVCLRESWWEVIPHQRRKGLLVRKRVRGPWGQCLQRRGHNAPRQEGTVGLPFPYWDPDVCQWSLSFSPCEFRRVHTTAPCISSPC